MGLTHTHVGSLEPAVDVGVDVGVQPETSTKISIKEGPKQVTGVAPVATVSPAVKAVAGSLGGLVEAVCLQPIDVIKTRLQLDHSGRYNGVVGCGRTILAEEGVGALWKGLTPFGMHLTTKYALRFGTNSFFQSLFRSKDGSLSDGARLAAGLGAGVTEAMIIVTPFEVIKTRLQQQRGLAKEALKYNGTLGTALTVAREEGPLALWNGATATVIRQGSNQMSMFYSKYMLDRHVWGKREGDGTVLTPAQSMTSGFVAACIGPVLNNPFDVVKTRMMAARGKGDHHYKGFFDCLVTVARNEGVGALWKGITPRLMRTPPGQAIVWAVTDQVCGHFEKKR